MKRLLLIIAVALFTMFSSNSCELLAPDKCDGTVKNEISFDMETNVFIEVPSHNDLIDVRVIYWKTPCGLPKKGIFEYNVKARSDIYNINDKTAWVQLSYVSYNLRNSKDEITVEVKITSGGYEEIKTYYYSYDDFESSNGDTHYSNFDFDWSNEWSSN